MTPKLQWRKIGNVNIFEYQGVFSEPSVKQNEKEMSYILHSHPSKGLLFNLRLLEKLDHSAVELILETTRQAKKSAILGHNLSSYFIAEHMRPNEAVPFFDEADEAIDFFEEELAEITPEEKKLEEKRYFPRIKTALPVKFEIKNENGKLAFQAVVLNLSEGGLYGRFLDSHTEELAKRAVDPFDLKMLSVRLRLPDSQLLKLNGKILRTQKEFSPPSGFALEFYQLEARERQQIVHFLEKEHAE